MDTSSTEYYNPHSNEWMVNRFDIYKDLRTRDTAYWSEKYQLYVFTRYEDVLFVLNNPNIFISGKGNLLIEHPARFGKSLGASDNPTHNDYKYIVKNAYSKDNIKRISELFRQKAIEQIDRKSTRLNSSHTDISRMPSSA